MRRIDRGLRQLQPVDRDLAEQAWLLYLSSDGVDRDRSLELLDILLYDSLRLDFEESILLPPPEKANLSGQYPLGDALYPNRAVFGTLGLSDDDWMRHVLIVGMSGAGKSNLALHILTTLMQARIPFLVLDWKQGYRDAIWLPGFEDLLVHTVARPEAPFKFNPLGPPAGVSAGEWLMKSVDVIKHAYFVGDGVEYLLRRAMDRAYRDVDFDKNAGRLPTFHEVRAIVRAEHAHGRMALWKASALRVLESLCFPHGLGPVVNDSTAVGLEDLLRRPVVLELDALADADKVFLIEALILWIYEYRKRQSGRERFRHALVIEEAHHVLSERKERTSGAETIMETCLRQIREYGESVIVIDQEPNKLSHSIRANTATKISFRLGAGDDARDMARDLNLHDDQTHALDLLRIGEAVVSIAHRIPRPVLVRFPLVQIRKGQTGSEQVEQRFLQSRNGQRAD